jgi:hypothetical protein
MQNPAGWFLLTVFSVVLVIRASGGPVRLRRIWLFFGGWIMSKMELPDGWN